MTSREEAEIRRSAGPWPGVLFASCAVALASGCGSGPEQSSPSPLRIPALAALAPVVPRPARMEAVPGEVHAGAGVRAEGPTGRTILSHPDDPGLQRLAALFEPFPDRDLRLTLTGDGTGGEFPRRDEEYRLSTVDPEIRIEADTYAGLFYGLQTLRQLRDAPGGRLPAVAIEDAPRFGYRGMHLDVGRHMFPVPFIERLIDEMARLKLNAFHWHLTEDQGWRIQIDAYPELTRVGAWRRETMVEQNFDPYVGDGTPYGGFYTKDEIRQVVAYAAERFVTVIPEIEMPGHATAALAAYPELSCTGGPIEVATTWGVHPDIFCPSEETFRFLETVLDEVVELFPGPYVHVGGDEAPKTRWEESELAQGVMRREGLADEEELQSWFIRRIERFLATRGRSLIGWDEILEGGLAPRATVMSWRGTEGGVEAARAGHDVIISPNADLYLDHYQGDPAHEPLAIGGLTTLEDVYAFEPVPPELSGAAAEHVLGPQANVWTEYMPTTEQVEYMVFPRLLALAEVAWSPAGNRDWDAFVARLPARLAALEARGVGYRVPPPTGLEEDVVTDYARATIRLGGPGGGVIRYTLDGSDPGPVDPIADGPIEVPATAAGTVVSARRFSPGGRPSPLRRAVVRSGAE